MQVVTFLTPHSTLKRYHGWTALTFDDKPATIEHDTRHRIVFGSGTFTSAHAYEIGWSQYTSKSFRDESMWMPGYTFSHPATTQPVDGAFLRTQRRYTARYIAEGNMEQADILSRQYGINPSSLTWMDILYEHQVPEVYDVCGDALCRLQLLTPLDTSFDSWLHTGLINGILDTGTRLRFAEAIDRANEAYKASVNESIMGIIGEIEGTGSATGLVNKLWRDFDGIRTADQLFSFWDTIRATKGLLQRKQ